jgi:hypothetical protein
MDKLIAALRVALRLMEGTSIRYLGDTADAALIREHIASLAAAPVAERDGLVERLAQADRDRFGITEQEQNDRAIIACLEATGSQLSPKFRMTISKRLQQSRHTNRADVLEEAAKVAERTTLTDEREFDAGYRCASKQIAAAIRALIPAKES